MSTDRIEELFIAALDRPSGERGEYVAARAGDEEVSREVLSLLRAHEARGRLDSIADQLRGLRATAATVSAADLIQRLASRLGDRYRIERELGRGGMAIVLLAEDLKHRRKVALKVLQPDVVATIGRARFLQEIGIAARLAHPHILPLHDSGEADGLLYYVMPYLEAESLRDRLKRQGHLLLEDALIISGQVADALSYAHSHGVIHRDIKPENILFEAGHAVVSDFGIARAMTAAGGDELPEAGILGTPAYMSPEQAAGRPVDGRSDIYSLGCVVYEMLTGYPPFAGSTVQDVIAGHRRDPVPALRATASGASDPVETALRRALTKYPDHRFATALEFAAAMTEASTQRVTASRRRKYAVLALVVLLIGGSSALARALLVSGRPDERSIGVIPVVNMSGDPANEYLSDGLTDELIRVLGQTEGLRVPSRTSAFYFKGKPLTARQIADSLQVATMLEATLRKNGEKLRISAQLINATSGHHLWSETYDREFRGIEELLAVQEEIARAIAGALQVRLTVNDDNSVVTRGSTANPQAYDLYLRARFFWNQRRPGSALKAVDNFRHAIAADSMFAAAYSGLADAYHVAARDRSLPREQAYLEARAAARRAIALDGSLAEGHTSMARVHQVHEWDLRAADREYRRAIALNSRYALAHAYYAAFLARGLGRVDAAIRHAVIAQELDPLSPAIHSIISSAMRAARRYDDAIAYARRAIDLAPDFPAPHAALGEAYRLKGMFEEALVEYQTAVRLGGREQPGGTADIYVRTGRRAEAVAIRTRLEQQAKTEDVWVQLARAHVALGENDRAIHALERALDTHGFIDEPTLAGVPDWDPLRSDPKFARLLTRIGLPL